MMVPTGLAERFGYVPEGTTGDRPLVLDAVVEAHRMKYGDAFSRQTCTEYLEIRSGQWLTKAFGRPAFYSGFAINGRYAYDAESDYRRSGFTGYSFTEARLSEGDALEIYAFEDSNGMDYYLYFLDDGQRIDELSIAAGQPKELLLEGLMFAYGGPMTDEDRKRNLHYKPHTSSRSHNDDVREQSRFEHNRVPFGKRGEEQREQREPREQKEEIDERHLRFLRRFGHSLDGDIPQTEKMNHDSQPQREDNEGDERPPRSFRDRGEDRDGDKRPRRNFKDRYRREDSEDDERPRRSFRDRREDRDGDERPRRSFRDKPQRDDRRGDRRGDRKNQRKYDGKGKRHDRNKDKPTDATTEKWGFDKDGKPFKRNDK